MIKNYEMIVHIHNNYYGYERSKKLIPIYKEDYSDKWCIDFLGIFENKSDIKKLFPNTSIKEFEKAQLSKFILEKIKEKYDKK